MSEKMRDVVLACLEEVSDPDRGADIVSLGMVSSVQIEGGRDVVVVIEVDPARGAALEDMRQEAERKIAALTGVGKVSVILTAEEKPAAQQQKPVADPHGMSKNPPVEVPARHIIVVASGKGGVGKSTVAANLAVSLARGGRKVGLLDADIYGPSQPLMMGDEDYKPETNAEKKLIPLERHGIKIMSMGFMVDRDKALVWRGPMVQTAFYQMLRDVAWGSAEDMLDYMIIDLPPGTGDVQLTLAQKVTVSGAVIVSTPQDIALIDARRAVEMFQKTGVPVLGVVENMSHYVCENCGHEAHIFGHGGAQSAAADLGVPFLGGVPLSANIRAHSDAGEPVVLAEPESAQARAFEEIAEGVVGAL